MPLFLTLTDAINSNPVDINFERVFFFDADPRGAIISFSVDPDSEVLIVTESPNAIRELLDLALKARMENV